MQFLSGFAWLIGFQLLGEGIVRWLHWPIPGAVLGMFFLFVALLCRLPFIDSAKQVSQQLLAYLSLFFVPAGAGLLLHLERIESQWLPIIVASLAGMLITMLSTAAIMALMLKATRGKS